MAEKSNHPPEQYGPPPAGVPPPYSPNDPPPAYAGPYGHAPGVQYPHQPGFAIPPGHPGAGGIQYQPTAGYPSGHSGGVQYPPIPGYPQVHPGGYQAPPQVVLGAPTSAGGPPTVVTVVKVGQWGPYPVQVVCSQCNARVMTETSLKPGLLTWLLSGALVFVGCWLGCCLIPCCIPECQDIEHHCPNCKALLGTFVRI